MRFFAKPGASFRAEAMSLAMPAFLEKLLLSMIPLVSSVILGRVAGAEALSAVVVATTLTDIFRSVYLGVGFGAAIVIAKDSDNREHVSKATLQAIFLDALLGLVIGLLSLLFCRSLMHLLFSQKASGVIELSISYLYIVLPISSIDAVDSALSSCLRGAHDAKTPFIITALVNLLNILLSFLFIGYCHWGVIGAAISYVICSILSCALRALMLFLPHSPIRLSRFYAPDKVFLRRIGKASLSSTLQSFFVNFAFLGMQAVTSLVSATALSGYSIANNVIKQVYCITYGIEAAEITMVANSIGKSHLKKARTTTSRLMITSQILCNLCAAAMFLFARPLCRLFIGNQSAEVLSMAVVILRVLCFSVPITTYYQSCQGALKVGGETTAIVLSSILGPWAVRIPLSIACIHLIEEGTLWRFVSGLFPPLSPTASLVLASVCQNGITGMMVGLFVDYTARALIYGLRLKKGAWLHSSL